MSDARSLNSVAYHGTDPTDPSDPSDQDPSDLTDRADQTKPRVVRDAIQRGRRFRLSYGLAVIVSFGLTTQVSASFDSAVVAYDQGQYQSAIEQWQEVVKANGNVSDVSTEYNLGNSYYGLGDYGRAVLHWERALRLSPADVDTRANLTLVQGMLADAQPTSPSSGPMLVASLARVRELDLDNVTWLALVTVHALGLALFALLVGAGRYRPLALVTTLLAVTVAVPSSAVVGWRARLLSDHGRFVVVAGTVDVRSGPGEQYTTMHVVHTGKVVVEAGESVGGWVSVRVMGGHDGWVPAHSVERI